MLVPWSHPFTQRNPGPCLEFYFIYQALPAPADCRSGTKNCHLIVTPFASWLVTVVVAAGLVCSIAWGFISWKQELWSQENFQITLFTYSNRDENLAGFSVSRVFPFPLCHPFTMSCYKTGKALNSSSQPQIAPLLLTVLPEILSISWFFSPKNPICNI